MEEMVCKIKCERTGCNYEEEVPAKRIFGRIYKKPAIPKDWGILHKAASIDSSIFHSETVLLCPKCFKEYLSMQDQFLNKKKSNAKGIKKQ